VTNSFCLRFAGTLLPRRAASPGDNDSSRTAGNHRQRLWAKSARGSLIESVRVSVSVHGGAREAREAIPSMVMGLYCISKIADCNPAQHHVAFAFKSYRQTSLFHISL